jgi:glycine cleavage system H protein
MNGLHFPEDRLYHKEHLWAQREADGSVRIGLSDFAQDRLGSVVFVRLPAVGAHFSQGESGAEIESVKITSEAIMPVSGKVVEVNGALNDTPELVNSSPYGEGWLARVTPDDPDEGGLLGASAYAALVGD